MLLAPFLAIVLPVRMAHRANTARRGLRIVMHITASLFLVGVCLLINTFHEWSISTNTPFFDAMNLTIKMAVRQLWSPRFGPLWIILIIIGWEIGLRVLALVLMPWGARDERLRDSYRVALGGVWMHIGSAAWIVAFVAATFFVLEHEYRQHQNRFFAVHRPVPPQPPVMPVNMPGAAALWHDYMVALSHYRDQSLLLTQRCWEDMSWFLRHWEEISITAGFIGAAFWVWLVLRTVAAPRKVAPIERPPLCEWCGYNLTTMSPDARCPECGAAVSASLGPSARSGTTCDRATWRLLPTAAVQCMMRSITDPQAIGRQLWTTRSAPGARRCLLLSLPAIAIIANVSVVAMILTLQNGSVDELGLYILVGFYFSIICTVTGIGGMLTSALIVGWWLGRSFRRNLLSAAMQMACYLSGWLVVWAAVGATTTHLTIYGLDGGIFRRTSNQMAFGSEGGLALLVWAVPNITMLVAYQYLLYRGTLAARYANR